MVLIVSQVEQHLFRRRAELLLAEIQSLELRKTPWKEAKTQLQRWRANTEFGAPCHEQKCSVTITPNQLVLGCNSKSNLIVNLDDYFRWRLRLSYDMGPFECLEMVLIRVYIRMGGRPARVVATAGTRDGIVCSKGFSLVIETYARNGPWTSSDGGAVEYTLLADTHSVPRFDYRGPNWVTSQLTIHPNYVIGRPSGCEICVSGWSKFSSYTNHMDVHQLMQLDLSCLTRWHPCLTQSDIMPAAWAQYLKDQPRLGVPRSQLMCSPSVIEMLGRDSTNLATGEIV